MLVQTTQTITYLADITDPTSDGIIVTLVNIGLGILAVITAGMGGKFAFDAWSEAKGKAAVFKELRTIGLSTLAVEAFFALIFTVANYGSNISSLIPGLG